MGETIHISEINSERWTNTSLIRSDNKIEFREKPQFGNRHVLFEIDSSWGTVHYDKYNALDFPDGTINHLAQYTEEKTSLPAGLAKIAIVIGGVYVGYKLLKFLVEDS